jgi:hypothetical protein
MENHHFLIGKSSINGPFSMAMLDNQMVCPTDFGLKTRYPQPPFWPFQKPEKKYSTREIHHLWTKPHLILATYPNKHIWLVVLTILKNMKVNGKDYPIYYGK